MPGLFYNSVVWNFLFPGWLAWLLFSFHVQLKQKWAWIWCQRWLRRIVFRSFFLSRLTSRDILHTPQWMILALSNRWLEMLRPKRFQKIRAWKKGKFIVTKKGRFSTPFILPTSMMNVPSCDILKMAISITSGWADRLKEVCSGLRKFPANQQRPGELTFT